MRYQKQRHMRMSKKMFTI